MSNGQVGNQFQINPGIQQLPVEGRLETGSGFGEKPNSPPPRPRQRSPSVRRESQESFVKYAGDSNHPQVRQLGGRQRRRGEATARINQLKRQHSAVKKLFIGIGVSVIAAGLIIATGGLAAVAIGVLAIGIIATGLYSGASYGIETAKANALAPQEQMGDRTGRMEGDRNNLTAPNGKLGKIYENIRPTRPPNPYEEGVEEPLVEEDSEVEEIAEGEETILDQVRPEDVMEEINLDENEVDEDGMWDEITIGLHPNEEGGDPVENRNDRDEGDQPTAPKNNRPNEDPENKVGKSREVDREEELEGVVDDLVAGEMEIVSDMYKKREEGEMGSPHWGRIKPSQPEEN